MLFYLIDLLLDLRSVSAILDIEADITKHYAFNSHALRGERILPIDRYCVFEDS